MISRESKIFFSALLLVILVSILITYQKIIVLRKFDIFTSEEDVPSYTDIYSEIKDITSLYVQ